MRIALLLPLFGTLCAAQAPAPASPAPPPAPPSSLVQPSLDETAQALAALRFDHWKKGSIRDEASSDSDSIVNNLHNSLPPLLSAADAAPSANSKLLPAFQNVDALYDVLLRIYSASRVVGQPEDVGRLEQLLQHLSAARRSLAERMMAQAEAQEKLASDLRASNQSLLAAKNTPPPQPPPCKPAAPVRHKAAKPAAKPPASTPAKPQTAAPAKPSS